MPRKGISVSLANLIAEIFPSIPRLPNPPGIKIPSYRLFLSKPMSFSSNSESICSTLTSAEKSRPA